MKGIGEIFVGFIAKSPIPASARGYFVLARCLAGGECIGSVTARREENQRAALKAKPNLLFYLNLLPFLAIHERRGAAIHANTMFLLHWREFFDRITAFSSRALAGRGTDLPCPVLS